MVNQEPTPAFAAQFREGTRGTITIIQQPGHNGVVLEPVMTDMKLEANAREQQAGEGHEMQARKRGGQAFVVTRQSTAARQPAKGAFDHESVGAAAPSPS